MIYIGMDTVVMIESIFSNNNYYFVKVVRKLADMKFNDYLCNVIK